MSDDQYKRLQEWTKRLKDKHPKAGKGGGAIHEHYRLIWEIFNEGQAVPDLSRLPGMVEPQDTASSAFQEPPMSQSQPGVGIGREPPSVYVEPPSYPAGVYGNSGVSASSQDPWTHFGVSGQRGQSSPAYSDEHLKTAPFLSPYSLDASQYQNHLRPDAAYYAYFAPSNSGPPSMALSDDSSNGVLLRPSTPGYVQEEFDFADYHGGDLVGIGVSSDNYQYPFEDDIQGGISLDEHCPEQPRSSILPAQDS